ncbi:hypothetical protein ACFV9E_06495 [Streptomyces sp. NPDC059835]|uniref:hypothetical protein n=1 Tax=Streptomyces sp. NPDC059835 TaxID=3346967 RepID=UPI0036605B75
MTENTTTDPVRDLHLFALHAHTTIGMRVAKDVTPSVMWERASGTAAAWCVHRLLARLAEVDPDGVLAFVEQLAEEGEWPEIADPFGAAEALGFLPQEWIDAEFARQDAASAESADGLIAELKAKLKIAERQARERDERVANLEATLERYVGQEPTVAEEMAYLNRCLNTVHDVCNAAEKQATRWEQPLPVPEWVAAVRHAASGGVLVEDFDERAVPR